MNKSLLWGMDGRKASEIDSRKSGSDIITEPGLFRELHRTQYGWCIGLKGITVKSEG